MAVFLGFNLVLEVFQDDISWLISFYGLGPQLTREFYETRSVGVFANPNITALTTSILLIFVLSGRKTGAGGSGRFDFIIASWLAAATAVLMISRNQFAAVGLLAAFAAVRTGFRVAWRQSIVLIALVLAIFVVGYAANDPIEDAIGFNPPGLLVDRFQLGLPGEGSAKEDSVSRPLLGLTPATDRWSRSPIVGTGFESSEEFGAPTYHNDWLIVAASSGVIGLIALTVIVYLLVRIEPLLLVLFVFPALTNSLIFAPQHLTAVMLLAGIATWRKEQQRRVSVVVSS
jgi:O-antigen ligase